MKKLLLILLAAILCSGNVSAGNSYEWYKTYGGVNSDAGRCIIKTSDGNLLTCGYSVVDKVNNADVYIVKTDIKGNKLWENTFGSQSFDYANSIIESKTGQIFIAGSTVKNGNSDLLVMGFSKDGNLLWSKNIGGDGNDLGKSVIVTSDSKLLVCGYTASFGAGEQDIYLVKLDLNGNIIWQKYYGGTATDIGTCVVEGKDKNYYLAATTGSFAAANRDAIIYKLDTAGTEIWKKNFNIDNFDFATQMIQTSDGGFALCGYSDFHGADLMNFTLWKTDSEGKLQWSKTYDHDGFYDYGRCIVQTSDKGFIIAGASKIKAKRPNQIMLVKTDSAGTLITRQYIEGVNVEWGNSMVSLDDNNVIVSGYSNSYGSTGYDLILYNIKIATVNDVKSEINKDSGFFIMRNYPNPFNPSTKINYTLPSFSKVQINIYDANGSLVKNLVNTYQSGGNYTIDWTGVNNAGCKVCSGTYIVNLKTDHAVSSRKIMLLK